MTTKPATGSAGKKGSRKATPGKTKGKAPARRASEKKPPPKPGRPSAYREEYVHQAERLALLGATDKEIAAVWRISVATLGTWKHEHPEFLEALKRGKDEADANVAASLYRRALGFTHPAVKIFADAKTGAVKQVPYTERYPPDTTACIFWLKNRQREHWRDRQDLEHTGKDGVPLAPPSKDEALTTILDRLTQVAEQSEAGRVAMEGAGLQAPP